MNNDINSLIFATWKKDVATLLKEQLTNILSAQLN